jgi:hypothetical protein
MRVPHFMVTLAITAAIGLQCWTLNEVVSLKVELARLTAVVGTHIEKGDQTATNEKNALTRNP